MRRILLAGLLVLIATPAFSQGRANLSGLRFIVSSQAVADNGLGTAATGTITLGKSYVELTCSDTHGCTMSLSETGAGEGDSLWIVNISANTATFADSSGVLEVASGTSFAMAQYQALLIQYIGDRWIEVARTGAGGAGSGDVVGPASSTDEAVARFDSTTGKLLQNSSTLTLSDAGALSFADGVRQTFNPNGTNAGVNVGSQAGDPGSPSNGDLWYDSTANELTARINGANVALGAGGGGVTGPGSSTDEALARFDGTGGSTLQNGTITMSDTGVLTFPDGTRQTFNPNGTSSGVNVGSQAGDPGTPSNGDIWYDSTANELTARINGSNIALGAGGSGYSTIQDETSSLTARSILNFTGTGVSCVDNSGATRTDCTIGASTDTIGITIDGAGSVISTGVKGFIYIPYAATITAATLLSTDAASTAGSIVIDIWKDSYANYPPTVADTITASAKPTLSSASKSQDSTLTGWTTSVSAGDIIAFKVDSATTVTRVTLILTVTR
jgi:hypothetical protein